jgi:hypothetical protein
MLRCRAWRDGRSRAIRDLRSGHSADADYLLVKLTDVLLHAPADETEFGRASSARWISLDVNALLAELG